MESRAKLFGHPIHQMLIVFPLGLLAMSLIFDVIGMAAGWSGLHLASFYMIGAGILAGLVAAVFGLVDYLAIPANTRAKRVGSVHGAGNVLVVALFALSWWLRHGDPAHPMILAVLVSGAASAIALFTGWLGGELVNRLSVGVDEGAHLDAPSSLHGPVSGEAREARVTYR